MVSGYKIGDKVKVTESISTVEGTLYKDEICKVDGTIYPDKDLRLKDSSLKTQFLNINELDIEEGDMILFDSRAMHRSPPNHTKDDKIILSFNLRLQSNQN